MNLKLRMTLIALIFLSGCTEMKPVDFKDTAPKFVIEDFFNGKTQASGIFEDRFGTLRRQFTVDIDGKWDGNSLVLDEKFLYTDGERDRRVWTIVKTGSHTYEGRAGDVIGTAKGEAQGNALNWQYEMDLKVGDGSLRVHFNDWMFLQPSGMVINRARVSKLGIEIGTVTLAFVKQDAKHTGLSNTFSEQTAVHAPRQAASQ
ncbi:MAG: DUF3833 domain-containing protein [Rhodospirillales bacterium]|nr:DUF3833 domain-containing protein [Rhodospirillales bacterium]